MVPALALLMVYGARTVVRNQDWRDEVRFYLGELRKEGESPVLRDLLTEAYLRRGMPREALAHAQAAVSLAPDDPRSHNTLAFVYWQAGERERALAEYRRAAQYARRRNEPGFAARILNNIAVAYSQSGRLDLALPLYRDAIRLDPAFVVVHANLGAALVQSGNLYAAMRHLRAATRLDPSSSLAYSNLGLALAARKDLAGARAALAAALRLEPNSAETLARAGQVELLAGDRKAAGEFFARALVLDPANPRARAGDSALRGGVVAPADAVPETRP